jgi:hypothetical protein
VLPDSADLDDQPDYLSRNPEGQLHTSFHVVPTTLCDHNHHPFYLSAERFPPGWPGDPTAVRTDHFGSRASDHRSCRRRSQVYRLLTCCGQNQSMQLAL